MRKSPARSVIRLRGVRHNNLNNFDLDLPLNRLIVVTGLSGSGKSSLAFDTLFAEGQRRYIETFSPYARQFFDRMDKPQVDSIEGIPPAIAIEQRNTVRTTRSTVGTMTEICDYMKVLWPELAVLCCRQCDRPVLKETPQSIWNATTTTQASSRGPDSPPRRQGPADRAAGCFAEKDLLITFDLPLSEKLTLEESLALVAKQGYQRLLVSGKVLGLQEAAAPARDLRSLTVVQDRLSCSPGNRARFVEACEQAYHFGKGKLTVWEFMPSASVRDPQVFSNRLHCASCDLEYREPSPALFSFNHPVGACPKCRGFGRVISIDYSLAIPDRSRTLAQGVVRPWQTGTGLECQADLLRMCRHYEIPTDVPFEKLPLKWQQLVIDGDPNYGTDEEHEWPRAWYGVKGYFRWLESKAYKMHIRVLLSRYRAYTTCPDCAGARFQPEALLYKISRHPAPATASGGTGASDATKPHSEALTLADFYRMPVRDSVKLVQDLARAQRNREHGAFALALEEVLARLRYLDEVGLGYLSLDRPTRSLSGGETERVNLTTCLGTRLVNTLFVLDEPSVGLHPRDTARLVRVLERLRDVGNTVVVVEHEAGVIRAADQIVDLGPGHGATGGQVVFQGNYQEILRCDRSLTGKYLSGRMRLDETPRRAVAMAQERTRSPEIPLPRTVEPFQLQEASTPFGTPAARVNTLRLSHATRHNLNDLEVYFPLNRLVCVSGVSGSGKTTLIREVLLPALHQKLKAGGVPSKASDRLAAESEDGEDETSGPMSSRTVLEGWQHLDQAVLVDQSSLGKTPRSNPAVYIGAFDDIRELFAQTDQAKRRGLNASAFSFNSSQGQCQRCRGAGFEKIEMQFLSDVFIRCPDCDGRRYRDHILELQISPPGPAEISPAATRGGSAGRVSPPSQRASASAKGRALPSSLKSWSIGDVLDATVEEAVSFLRRFPESRPAQRAAASLALLEEVGLGYLKLGQPINTLSGGESQRLKLVRHLAEAAAGASAAVPVVDHSASPEQRTLFLFDEPTTGLHFHDVRLLLKVFQRLVNAGHSVFVIEHNLDVIRSADWVIDLGPGAGDEGGRIVAQGTPEDLMAAPDSPTGRALLQTQSPIPPARTRTPANRSATPS